MRGLLPGFVGFVALGALGAGPAGCGSGAAPAADGSGAVDADERRDAAATDDRGLPRDAGSEDAGPPPGPCASGVHPPVDSVWTVTVGGQDRTFRVHVPARYDPATPTPLVLNFHGVNTNARQQELISKMPAKADAAGFVVIHPEGIAMSWNGGTCCGQAYEDDVDDVGFARALLDEVEAKLCIDPHRIFVAGLSNGGYMTNRLGCELADRVAAIAPVSGGNLIAGCTPARPIAVLYFHGTADTIVPYAGGYGLPAAAKTFSEWGARNGCTGSPVTTFTNGAVHCETYAACAAGVEVTLCTIEGGGHQWPGGTPIPMLGETTTDIIADDAMWDFFQRHPLP